VPVWAPEPVNIVASPWLSWFAGSPASLPAYRIPAKFVEFPVE
jgi:hypothetical protein